jgi:hypothetical protein
MNRSYNLFTTRLSPAKQFVIKSENSFRVFLPGFETAELLQSNNKLHHCRVAKEGSNLEMLMT